jgi:hypothetical protein
MYSTGMVRGRAKSGDASIILSFLYNGYHCITVSKLSNQVVHCVLMLRIR